MVLGRDPACEREPSSRALELCLRNRLLVFGMRWDRAFVVTPGGRLRAVAILVLPLPRDRRLLLGRRLAVAIRLAWATLLNGTTLRAVAALRLCLPIGGRGACP